jgi:hypothetical protein
MKLSEIKQLMEAVMQLESRPEFEALRRTLGDKVANDVLVAWRGDAQDYQRSGGKNFEPLTPRLLNPDVLARKYGIRLTPDMQRALSGVVQLAHHAFPNVERLRAPKQSPYATGVWGQERFARESKLTPDESALYESLQEEVALLTSDTK